MNTYLSVLALTQLIVEIAESNPIIQRALWENPCAGHVVDEDQPRMRQLQHHQRQRQNNIIQLLHIIKEDAILVAQGCTEIKDHIVREEYLSTPIANILRYAESLADFPSTEMIHHQNLNLSSTMLTYNERLSRVGVFLDLMVRDTPEYSNVLDHLVTYYTNSLCGVHMILHSQNQEVTSRVSRDIVPSIYTGSGVEELNVRHGRNYLVMRDMKALFLALADSIDSFILRLLT